MPIATFVTVNTNNVNRCTVMVGHSACNETNFILSKDKVIGARLSSLNKDEWLFHPRGGNFLNLSNRRLAGPQSQAARFGEKQN